jgi:peptidoglycan/LPS O-acetylase OafA/YrhL
LLVALSVISYSFASGLNADRMLSKLMGVFVLPYLYNFIFGIVLYKNWDQLKRFLQGKGFYWLFFYVCYSLFFSLYLNEYKPAYWPNLLGFVANLILALTVVSVAFTFPDFSNRLLKGNDFSYGIYIYHMLCVNVFVQIGCVGNAVFLMEVLLLTICCASVSWFFIEKKIMKYKMK